VNTTNKTIHLVLTHHWYDEIASGRKLTEYRAKNRPWTMPIRRMARRVYQDSFQMNIVTCKACGSSQTRKPRPCIKCGAELPQTAIQATVIPDNDLGLVSFKDRMKKK